MDYRIKKISYRNEETGEIKSYFTIEEYREPSLFKNKEWIPLSIRIYMSSNRHWYSKIISYDTEREACAHLRRLKEKVPEDEIVTCS